MSLNKKYTDANSANLCGFDVDTRVSISHYYPLSLRLDIGCSQRRTKKSLQLFSNDYNNFNCKDY